MSHMACLMAAPNLRESVLGQERLLWMLKFTAGVGENKMVCIVVLSELIQSCNSSLEGATKLKFAPFCSY